MAGIIRVRVQDNKVFLSPEQDITGRIILPGRFFTQKATGRFFRLNILKKFVGEGMVVAQPFAGNNRESKICCICIL